MSHNDEWMELFTRVTTSECEYRALAGQAWRDHDYGNAIRYRGIADGLEIAREHHAQVIADAKTKETK